MQHIFIVNPNARNAKKVGEKLEEYAKAKKNVKVYYSKDEKDPEKILKNKPKDTVVYSVGGDGTLNTVLNAVMKYKMSLGIIPAGTGNDFFRMLESQDEDKIMVDVGKVNDRYFLNIASLGLDATIADNVSKMKKIGLPSFMVYPASIVYTLFKYKGANFKINEEEQKQLLVAICNGKYYGNGISISPTSDIKDGNFDIYTCPYIGKIKTLKLISKLLKGKHMDDPLITVTKTSSLHITSKEDLICNIDGEIVTGNDFAFSLEKEILPLVNTKKIVKELMK